MIRRLLVLAALVVSWSAAFWLWLGNAAAADVIWAATTGLMLVPLTWSVARALWRHDVGVDAIALIAMASALATGEYLAGGGCRGHARRRKRARGVRGRACAT